jgi:hypothetical protein
VLPDLAREGSIGEHVLGRQPDSDTLGRPCEVVRAKTFQRSLNILGVHLAGGQIVHALVDDPSALLADPWLLLCEVENEIDDLGPVLEGCGGLEKNAGFDDRFRAEEPTEEVIALFLQTGVR